jgi:alkylation response protein AidB-like acyl-CoA dehydrogenase
VDFADSPDDARFRAELRAWLAAHKPARAERVPHDDASLADEFAFLKTWQRTLHDAGYVGLLWPREYGGHAAPPVHQAILNEELARARAPQLLNRVGINNAGPTLITHGSADPEAAAAAPDPHRRRGVVPALQRARARAATSPRSARGPSVTATPSASPARRCGRATPSSHAGESCSRAPIRRSRSTAA